MASGSPHGSPTGPISAIPYCVAAWLPVEATTRARAGVKGSPPSRNTVPIEICRGLDPQDGRTAELLRQLVNNALNRQAADRVERIQDGALVSWRARD